MPIKNEREAPEAVPGLYGELMTGQDLPAFYEKSCGAIRKAQVIAAVEQGLLSLIEARRCYGLLEESASWQRALHSYGTRWLQAISLRLSQRRERGLKRANKHVREMVQHQGARHG